MATYEEREKRRQSRVSGDTHTLNSNPVSVKETKPAQIATDDIKPIIPIQPKNKVKPQVKFGSPKKEKTESDEETDELDKPIKVRLSVPLLVKFLRKGMSYSAIGRVLGLSRQAVSDYCNKHSDELAPVMDTDDNLALILKHNAVRAAQKLSDVLLDDMTKKDMIPLMAVVDRSTNNYRVLSEQSTGIQVVRIESNVTRPVIEIPSSMVNEIVSP